MWVEILWFGDISAENETSRLIINIEIMTRREPWYFEENLKYSLNYLFGMQLLTFQHNDPKY